jgi:hypothetical protein
MSAEKTHLVIFFSRARFSDQDLSEKHIVLSKPGVVSDRDQ